jgi:trafficking protein particle complex subunit 10
MGLLEDALLQYEELEAAFFQVTKEKNLSWFGKLINPDPEDDSLPILALDKKPYRDLILANSITVFDIRVYLLAIQSEILGRQQLFVEIIRKVQIEVASIANILKILEVRIPFLLPDCY